MTWWWLRWHRRHGQVVLADRWHRIPGLTTDLGRWVPTYACPCGEEFAAPLDRMEATGKAVRRG